AAGLAINIGTGNRYTLNRTLVLLERISGRPALAKFASPREGDIRDSQADITLAREVLGYQPRIGFEDGLRRTWDWFLQESGRTEPATAPDLLGTYQPESRILGETLAIV